MAVLQWSPALELAHAEMDAVHRAFVEMMAQVEAAPDSQVQACWEALIAHTQAHFDQEDRWMQATGFAPQNCHSTQHQVVLQVLRESLQVAQAQRVAVIRRLLAELGPWFLQHAQSMDAALALHLKSLGHEPASGQLSHPSRLPAQAIMGCGGACSGDARDAREASAPAL